MTGVQTCALPISKYQGQGIAKTLVKCIIENSEKCNKNLIAECSYAKKVLEMNNNISTN